MDDRYIMGSCHHFAVAMHRLTGWELAVVAANHRGEQAIYHVFCMAPDGAAWDARGASSVSDLIGEQEAMDGADVWPVRLPDEAAVWGLVRAGYLSSIHESHIIGAIDSVDEVVDGACTFVTDGWKPVDPNAVEDAREGRRPPPPIGREASFDPATTAGPGPR